MSEPARVMVPYVAGMLRDETLRAVKDTGLPHDLVELSELNDHAYGRLLVSRWRRQESMVIVEQDMVPTPEQIIDLATCDHRWCGFSYYCGTSLIHCSFGLVRLDGRLMFDHPTLGAQAAMVAGDPHRPTPWWSLAEQMAARLMICGYTWHHHGGPVTHLHGRGAYE